MSKTAIKDYDEIIEVVNKYIEGLIKGKKEVVKQVFIKRQLCTVTTQLMAF